MLLYTLPLNDARGRGGLLPVNSFWASGSGALPDEHRPVQRAGLLLRHTLRDAALLQDWSAWSAAWQQVDGAQCRQLNEALDRGDSVTLTLCGECNAHRSL